MATNRYSSSTNASRVADGIGRGNRFPKPPNHEGAYTAFDAESNRTIFGAFSVSSGKTARIAKRLSSRLSEPSTFYREATPPGSSHGEPATRLENVYDGRYDYVAPPAPLPVATICGIRRRKFLITVWSIVALIVIIAVAVGVGVAVGLRKHNHSEKAVQSSGASRYAGNNTMRHTLSCFTNMNASTTSSGTPTTSTSSTTTSTASNAASTTAIPCPAANNTQYLVPETKVTFRRFCGIDYSGPDQARDLTSIYTNTMQDCMFQCADFPGCTACGWGIIAETRGASTAVG